MADIRKNKAPHNVGDLVCCTAFIDPEIDISCHKERDFGLVIDVQKIGGRYKYKIKWQSDGAIVPNYESADILAYKEFAQSWIDEYRRNNVQNQ
jgi:hypothetical protein